MQPAALHTSSLFTRPMHMQGRLPMGNTQQQGFFRVLLKCVKGEIIGQSGRWAVRVPRASIPEMIATSRSHLTAELKLPDGHYVVQTGARHAGRMPMSYLRRDATKPVMNVHLRPAPMPKTSTMHRNIDTSVRYIGIGLRSARARPGGGGGAPENTCGPRGRPEPHPPARASRGRRRTPNSYAVRPRPVDVGDATCTARAVAVAAAPRGRLGVTGHPSRPPSALY